MKPRKPLQRKSRLRPVSVRKELRRERDAIENAERSGMVGAVAPERSKRRRAVSPASPAQRQKVKEQWCRKCLRWDGNDPAHITPRSMGGCDDDLCVLPLCRECHYRYDSHELDVLSVLTFAEQAHAVEHLGLLRALRRITNTRWKPTD